MRLNANVNSVINDIMSSDCTAVMLVASEKFNKADFISELSSRYFKNYCFSAKVDDMFEICITLAQRILLDDPELCLRLRQLLFCRSRYNGVKTIMNVLISKLASYKQEVLIVFEDLELLPKDYDYTNLMYLINNAPQNLKVVLSSNSFLSVGLHLFEPKYPMLVDESALSNLDSLCTYDEYICDLSDEQIAFLCYAADCTMMSKKYLEGLDYEGARVLEYLSHKGNYVYKREREDFDDAIYNINKEFAKYLVSIRDNYTSKMGAYKDTPISQDMFHYTMERNQNYFTALLYAYGRKDIDSIELLAKKIFNCSKHIPKLPNFLHAHKELLKIGSLEHLEGYPYIKAFQLFLYVMQNYELEETAHKLKAMEDVFAELGDNITKHIVMAAECLIYDKLGNKQAVLEILEHADIQGERDTLKDIGLITKLLLTDFPRYVDMKPSEIERLLSDDASHHFWYFKALEDLGFFYYKQGNYRKSLEISEKLKGILPYYQIPPRIIAMAYFENCDVDNTEKRLDEALKFALANDLTQDIYMLYTAKSLVYSYRGEVTKSREYSNLSLTNIDKEDCYEKFLAIMIRIWQYAKAGEHKYAHDLANVYLHYTRSKAPEYIQYMATALGYALFKMGRYEDSYILAREAIQVGSNRSVAWLMSMGMATNYLLSKGELQEVDTLLTNIIKVSTNYGMNMLLADYANDVFAPILGYAQDMNIEPKSIEEIMHAVRIRDGDKELTANVLIKMFGNVSITTEGKEIQWKTRKAKDLFMHYILVGKVGLDRNVLLDLLWKDYLYESAINNLKTTNNIIRKTLDSYGIEYKLNYINSRYSLSVARVDNEYLRYKMLMESFSKEDEIEHKVEIMDSILKIYRGDLCTDINYPEFEHERTSVKQELIINMIKLIRLLAKAGEYLESKRFLNALMLIDADNDYSNMAFELDRFIKLTK